MRGILKLNEPLAPHTSWHVGGNVERYYRPFDLSDLTTFLKALPLTEPITWLGLGSNVLVADAGIKGTVIHTLGMGAKDPLIVSNSPTIIRAEAGLPCAKLAKFCVKHGYRGGEFFAGIPGTVGGALMMNAGAFGGETWKYIETVEIINRKGERFFRQPSEYKIEYRKVTTQEDEWFVAGHFQFEIDATIQASDNIKQLLRRRNETQPIGVFSCGSVFKNPPNGFAGRLIESCGLKGFKINDAEISTKHANFIINRGGAKACDIVALIQHIMKKVWEKHQIRLQPEVRLLGFEDEDWLLTTT